MVSKPKSLLAIAAITTLACSTQLQATGPILDFNDYFSSYTPGTQLVHGTDTSYENWQFPILKPWSLYGHHAAQSGDYGDPLTLANSSTVGMITIANNGKGVNMITAAGNNSAGAVYLDTQFSVAAPILNLTFDLSIASTSVSASDPMHYPLAADSSAYASQVFGANVFNGRGENILRFAAAATDENGGIFGIRVPDGASWAFIPFYKYDNDEAHNISLIANFTTGKLDILVDGKRVYLDDPNYLLPIDLNNTLSEIFFFANGSATQSNGVYFGGISAFASVPEPASLGLLALGGAALLFRRSKR